MSMMSREHFMGYGTSSPINPSDYNYAPPTQSSYNNSQHTSPPSINANSTNGSFQHESILKKAEIKKPRMVAEVKPMTYSDVLSKNVSSTKADSAANNTVSDGPNVQPKNTKAGKNFEKNKNNSHFSTEKKTGANGDDKDILTGKGKSTTGSANGRTDDQSNNSSMAAKEHKLEDELVNKSEKSHDADPTSKNTAKKRGSVVSGNTTNANGNVKNANKAKNATGSNDLNKKRVQNNVDFEQVKVDETKNAKNSGYFYNVTKNESQSDKVNKQYQSSSRKVTNRTAATSSSSSSSLPSRSSNKTEKSSTSYQKRNQRSRQNNTYTMLAKLLEKWLEYMVKFILWLYTLVYDVVVLSFGIIFERCHTFIDYSLQWYQILRTELKNNSGLPTAYCKNMWLKFDKKFAKESKWAFWRRIFNRKKVHEPIPEYVRSGRLPSTGDEAMYSLMNCKGKDAYR